MPKVTVILPDGVKLEIPLNSFRMLCIHANASIAMSAEEGPLSDAQAIAQAFCNAVGLIFAEPRGRG